MIKFIQQRFSEEQRLSIPAALLTFGVGVLFFYESFLLPEQGLTKTTVLIFGCAASIYAVITFVYLLPLTKKRSWVKWVVSLANGVLMTGGVLFNLFYSRGLFLTFIATLIITSAIIFGRWPTYSFAAVCFIADWMLLDQTPSEFGIRFLFDWLSIPVFSAVAVETIWRMVHQTRKQVHRLQVLNMVAKTVSSSLEIRQVIALLNSTIQNALDADTYYVGLIEENQVDSLHLELLFDEGEFFPPSYLPLKNTLAGWVIHNRKSLLTGNLPEQMPHLGIQRYMVGRPKPSLSWMGTPLQSGERLLGLVAVASYKYSEFSKEDLQLLENVAQQASMAIDNAYHHTEVERQSQLDSLTGALNHGSFIQKLAESAEYACVTLSPVSVIMLDIDKFKSYNDQYGHLVGDQVLTRLTEVIKLHIRESDYVGRWGGEEFSIALPATDTHLACQIGRRIQQSMSEVRFTARDGSPIPAPTVSLGIATCPQEAATSYSLIDAADQRLYTAKNRGRNEIEPHLEDEAAL